MQTIRKYSWMIPQLLLCKQSENTVEWCLNYYCANNHKIQLTDTSITIVQTIRKYSWLIPQLLLCKQSENTVDWYLNSDCPGSCRKRDSFSFADVTILKPGLAPRIRLLPALISRPFWKVQSSWNYFSFLHLFLKTFTAITIRWCISCLFHIWKTWTQNHTTRVHGHSYS